MHFSFTLKRLTVLLVQRSRSVMNPSEYFFLWFLVMLIIPPHHRMWNGSILAGFTPMSVRPSVHPSICKQGFRIFLKKQLAQFFSYLAFILMGWVAWPLYIFVFLASFSALWWPNIWPKMGFLLLFEKIIGPIHFIPGIYILMGWVSWPLYIFVFLASFLALWWPIPAIP